MRGCVNRMCQRVYDMVCHRVCQTNGLEKCHLPLGMASG